MHLAGRERRVAQHTLQEAEVRGHAEYHLHRRGIRGARDRGVAIGSMHDEFREHRVERTRYRHPRAQAAVDPHSRARRIAQ